nr:MAG TPA: Histidine kinase-like ATPase [Caudoviricetes sp.]
MKFFSNIVGRVRNFNLPKKNALIPLFEAISNSIHAIDELNKIDGHITVTVSRYGILGLENDDNKIYGNIDSFEILDNGIGLDDENFKSFMEVDTTHKYKIGGKGIGRFTWLKAFENVEVKSCFLKDNTYYERNFSFNLDNNDISEDTKKSQNNSSFTSVKLISYLTDYAKYLPKTTEDLAEMIIEHFFAQIIGDRFPKIILIDNIDKDEVVKLDILEYFQNNILISSEIKNFNIDKSVFEIIHTKIKAKDNLKSNKLYLSANGRIVKSEELEKLIVDMNSSFYKNTDFGYLAILKSDYLDSCVDSGRMSFNIPDEKELIYNITLDEILDACKINIEEYLNVYLEKIRNEKITKIKKFVIEDTPQYKHLFKYANEELLKINPDISDEKLDDELNKIKRMVDKKAKSEFNKFYKDLNSDRINKEDYEELLRKNMEKITDLSASSLAEYVGHRKVIIEVLSKTIRKDDNEKYHKEEEIHNIIYPMRTDSDSQLYENHNLWLIDEKLAYSEYISSDIPFNNDSKEGRPDILMLNDTTYLVADTKNEGRVFESIVLFELKRPMRNDYSRSEETPYKQMFNYIDRLRNNTVKDRNGRPIKVDKNTRYFLYGICDITSSLEKHLIDEDFEQTLDKLGYYKYYKNYKSYVEIISYDKMINDARKRNRIFFDKLGI